MVSARLKSSLRGLSVYQGFKEGEPGFGQPLADLAAASALGWTADGWRGVIA